MNQFLKCDEPSCGHTVPVEEILASHVNSQCPKCGSILLTKSDYEQWLQVKKILKISDWLDKVLTFFGIRQKKVNLSLSKEDLAPGETYAQALLRKAKEQGK